VAGGALSTWLAAAAVRQPQVAACGERGGQLACQLWPLVASALNWRSPLALLQAGTCAPFRRLSGRSRHLLCMICLVASVRSVGTIRPGICVHPSPANSHLEFIGKGPAQRPLAHVPPSCRVVVCILLAACLRSHHY
jgi:hypothetical protein